MVKQKSNAKNVKKQGKARPAFNTIITYGSFDVLHHGHIRLLERAKKLGNYLIVGLSTDEFNLIKGKISYNDFKKRKEVLESIKYINKIIPEDSWEQKETDIKKYNVDIFVMGSDWEGKFDYLKEFCEVVYLPRTENVSSTNIISKMQDDKR